MKRGARDKAKKIPVSLGTSFNEKNEIADVSTSQGEVAIKALSACAGVGLPTRN